MAEDVLVDSDIEAGRRLIAFLDENGYPVATAFWLHEFDPERWRLQVAFHGERPSYLDLERLVRAGNAVGLLSLDNVSLHETGDRLMRSMPEAVGPVSTPKRIRNRLIDGYYVEDALVYRVAA